MLGTLNGALEVRDVKLNPDAISCDVTGVNEIKDRLPVLTQIRIRYRLKIPQETRETVDRVLERHQAKCPTAQTLRDAVEITWTANVEEV